MSDSLYERVFEQTPAPVAVHEPGTARFDAVNRAYATALGYDPAKLEGESLTDLARGELTALTAAIEQALDGEHQEIEVALTGGSGTTRQVALELDPVGDGDRPQLASTLRTVRDQEANARPTSSERRLEIALAGTDTGVWEWDMATDEVVWTESMERLFGLDPGTFEGTFEAFAERVHPDDRSKVEAAIERAIERDELFQTEYRIERDDGEQRWVHARGELQETEGGDGCILGVLTDITEQKQNEQSLRQQERHYRQLVERLTEAHYTLDSEWRITFCNEALAERLDMTVEEVEGERIWDLLPEAKGSDRPRGTVSRRRRRLPVALCTDYEW